MKKVMSLVLVLAMVLACVSFAACGGAGGGGAAPPSDGGATPPSDGGVTPPSDGGVTPPSDGGVFTWNDMPAYSGASHMTKGSWAIPPEQGEWQRVEWRYYESGDSQSQIVAFYQSAMPANGWQQIAAMEMEEVSWFYYAKNNEQDGAIVWVTEEDGQTVIGLMRGGQ